MYASDNSSLFTDTLLISQQLSRNINSVVTDGNRELSWNYTVEPWLKTTFSAARSAGAHQVAASAPSVPSLD